MVHKLVIPSFVLEKSVQGSYNQSHSKFGETAGMHVPVMQFVGKIS